MAVTAQMVKELREKTGAGMMDCKKALEACDGNMDVAIDWLREKGIAKAAKKADRVAAEGLCNVVVDGNTAVIYELNSETDFVAKNEQFLNLIARVGQALIEAKPTSVEAALAYNYEGQTVENIVVTASSTIGEKITLRRVKTQSKNNTQTFGSYKHMGGRIAVLTLLDGANDEVAKDISMHVAASNPKFLDETSVDQHAVSHEREMFAKELENELSNETNEKAKAAKTARIPQIVEGKVTKWLKESCLVAQPFVKNPDITVEQYVKSHNGKVVSYIRFEVGEGIEKQVTNFAEEVMSQVRA
ncbi:MAG: tsf [Haloplasmataceae bacterium]|jgi:elongation factor Ts|nr:tsf [Haloplasmataceae bacterium]